ncbi:MAG: hypothetical protein RI897_2975 [Verrucomicrobiota bacterium]
MFFAWVGLEVEELVVGHGGIDEPEVDIQGFSAVVALEFPMI